MGLERQKNKRAATRHLVAVLACACLLATLSAGVLTRRAGASLSEEREQSAAPWAAGTRAAEESAEASRASVAEAARPRQLEARPQEEGGDTTVVATSRDNLDKVLRDAEHEKLNVIVFYPDDWRHDDLEGVADVLKTPFLRQLAKEGVRFARNAVTTSICWISRATLFSGQYVSRHKSTLLGRPFFSQPGTWERSWPALLKEKGGYFTGLVGKWQYMGARPGLFDFQRFYHSDSFWYPKTNEFGNVTSKEHVCDKTKQDAIDFLNERPRDKPFALVVSLAPPKGGVMPDQTTPEYYSLYEHAFIPEPFNQSHAYSLLPWFLQDKKSQARVRWQWRYAGFGKYQQSMKTYFALLTQVDKAIEEVVKVVKEQGVYDKTMIIFTSDNGEFRAAHGLSDKWYPYEESIRVPLIIKDPRMPKEKIGTVDEALTLNVDLASTILGAAGLASDPGMQGRDMADLYLPCRRPGKDAAAEARCQYPWRSEYYYEFPLAHGGLMASSALVRKKWKFMSWKWRNYTQLFNLENDPLEMNDLANLTQFAGVKEDMRARHQSLSFAVMAPIVPGTECDPLWPPGTKVDVKCCCEGPQIDLNEFANK